MAGVEILVVILFAVILGPPILGALLETYLNWWRERKQEKLAAKPHTPTTFVMKEEDDDSDI